jgi:hypothetical protein
MLLAGAGFSGVKNKKARRILADLSGCLANTGPTPLVIRRKPRLQ